MWGPQYFPNSAFPEGHNSFTPVSPHTHTPQSLPPWKSCFPLSIPLALGCSQGIQATNPPPWTPTTPYSSPYPPAALASLCQFLDTWNQGQDWKRRWRRQRKFIDTQGTQASKHSFFSCTNYGAVPSCPRVSLGWLSIILLMLYCAEGDNPTPQAWDTAYYLVLTDEEKWKKATGLVRLPYLFSFELVAARFRKSATFENGELLRYMWKTNLKLIKCDISHFGNW